MCYNYLKMKVYITNIMPLLLYGCATWSITWEHEHRVRVLEKRVLKRIFDP